MDSISWFDAIQASVGSCLPCFQPKSDSDHNNYPNNRRPPQHLESLLADVHDTDTEAETVSLHSNLGSNAGRKKKKRQPKKITLFGYDLFGKRTGAIHLPEDGTEDSLLGPHHHRRTSAATTRSSSLTFDSDAAPLNAADIDDLTPAQLEDRAREAEEQAEEERIAKEERRQRRKERKELKRLAQALASGAGGSGEDFEGFQGSGVGGSGAYPRMPSPMLSPGAYTASSAGSDEFGAFRQAITQGQSFVDDADEADGAADLDGMHYTRRNTSGHNSNSGGGSDSLRSPPASQASQSHPFNTESLTPSSAPSLTKKHRKSKSKSSKSRSSATSSTHPSSALASPVGDAFPGHISLPSHTGVDGKPSFDAGFPSPGLFGGPRGFRGESVGGGAFLARRGDDDDQ